ncbi:hypothetical protein SEVIR_9G040600v4 [Setaria viridis]|uniref:BHLH domain-containing protein n=2 Tax=Setaria TaxID=4554 RepID=A0A368SD61_SETIT|nr:transcription factor bHLH106-like [Setaria italica]XP_034574349.1 transcription factor bHLH106-like isoform X2 [Setaria viridis]RCV40294.1 hypothetical protein SETIT_9G041300v2 [Setaria italica]TKV90605.1 hypothetical protein SEVIR_9G040600v2 [Setaria viridis]
MFPAAEVSALAGAAGRQGEGGVVPMAMLPPFFMDSIWPAAAGGAGATGATDSEEDEAAAAAAAAAAHDRALAASRNHREAEKRRRERIKSHLDRLRSVLSCDPKIDKASLLAKAVERVRDLKQRVAGVGEAAPAHLFPTEHDEIVVLASGGAVFEASVCCDDRSDLLPELIETLRALRLRTLRAEMATLGGRVRNVLVLARDVDGSGVTGDDDGYGGRTDSAGSVEGNAGGGGDFLKEALRALVERPGAGGGDRPKRRRVSGTNMQAAA